MIQARPRRLLLCLLMSAFALGSVTRVTAEQIFFANGRSMSVKDYRIDGDIITVTLRQGGEASFDRSLVMAIRADEMPAVDEAAPAAAVVASVTALQQSARAAHAPLDSRPFADLIETVSLRHGVDPELVHAVVMAESNYQPRAKSGAGARGLMQVMPETAEDFGIKGLYDPQNNLEAGVQYLKFLLTHFDLKRAIAAYNAGPATVQKYNGIPPFEETRDYVKKVYETYTEMIRKTTAKR
jgi:soluble lytic murein transglycosylase-like protein